ncbi:hypothetical protein, partial [Pseudomonas sp. AFW1]|uniref:DUF5862 family protein n=1 Tax=Pseudomonas sp. AFW1 TaxID=2807721 RepID=UPI001EEF4E7C
PPRFLLFFLLWFGGFSCCCSSRRGGGAAPATGMAIGGKWGGAGGFGFGALSQLVGLIVPTAMGAIAGGTVGLFTNAETAVGYLGQYRENFGPGDVGRTTI